MTTIYVLPESEQESKYGDSSELFKQSLLTPEEAVGAVVTAEDSFRGTSYLRIESYDNDDRIVTGRGLFDPEFVRHWGYDDIIRIPLIGSEYTVWFVEALNDETWTQVAGPFPTQIGATKPASRYGIEASRPTRVVSKSYVHGVGPYSRWPIRDTASDDEYSVALERDGVTNPEKLDRVLDWISTGSSEGHYQTFGEIYTRPVGEAPEADNSDEPNKEVVWARIDTECRPEHGDSLFDIFGHEPLYYTAQNPGIPNWE